MSEIKTEGVAIKEKVRAIVQFGPPTVTSGLRPAEYFQVTIDPNMKSPTGEFIRFGQYHGDEITGWQRISAMTVCEMLGKSEKDPLGMDGYTVEKGAEVVMRVMVD